MPLKLVDRGYDVWMPNNRGTRYSNSNINDGHHAQTSKQRWDFSYAELGMYDQPAFIDKILKVTGKSKLTYIGYSLGTSQMFYGLSKLHNSYYADRLNSFVALAPCLKGAVGTRDDYLDAYLPTHQLGVYALGSENWEDDLENICANLDAKTC